MNKYRRLMTFSLIVVLFFASYFFTHHQSDHQAQNDISNLPVEENIFYNRQYIEGYRVDENALLRNLRNNPRIIRIDQERVYYVRAGYWRISNQDPTYRNTPDHPIMIYTARGEFRPLDGLGSPPSVEFNATPLPSPPTPTEYTLALDAVTGLTFYYSGEFMDHDQFLSQVLDYDHTEYMRGLLTQESDWTRQLNATPIGLDWPQSTPLIPMP
jgi:hypothetical protein